MAIIYKVGVGWSRGAGMHTRSVTNFDAGTKIWGGIEIYGSIHHDSTSKKYNICGNEHISI